MALGRRGPALGRGWGRFGSWSVGVELQLGGLAWQCGGGAPGCGGPESGLGGLGEPQRVWRGTLSDSLAHVARVTVS